MKTRPGRSWAGRLLALDLVLLALLAAWVLAQAYPSSEAVRLRNALMYQGTEAAAALTWAPSQAPADFHFESLPPPPALASALTKLKLAEQPDDWARSVAIARHLQARIADGGPIMAGLEATYARITEQGDGYCGDFTRVFSVLASAAGIVNRQWSFAFDGYGGHGHIFNEVWDAATGRWRAIDVYNNYLFVDAASGEPLSALEFRAALRGERAPARIVPLNPDARPGFAIPAKAEEYYRRGAGQWYVQWGNTLVKADRHTLVRSAGHISRHLEQLAAILAGAQPGLRIVDSPESATAIQALATLRHRLLLAGDAALVLGMAAVILAVFAIMARRRRAAAAPADTSENALRLAIVGPLPPPSGGMANQCRQLVRLLQDEGLAVELVRTNAPYRPAWVGQIPMLRAGFRLLPYLLALWRAAGRNTVFHIFANSGWAWHLFAAPAVAIARARGVRIVINYRGGNADPFLASTPKYVRRMLAEADALVTPSGFLRDVFAKYGLAASIVPNIIDLTRFSPDTRRLEPGAPHLIVTRNLEPIYNIPTAIRAFAQVRAVHPRARLTVAGSGPELAACEQLAAELGVKEVVRFAGRIDNDQIGALYASADIALNPSTVDNMPISILEAYASGVPVVSTDVGGIPYIASHEQSALLVPPRQPEAMAAAVLRLLADSELAYRLAHAGLEQARRYAWAVVREQWLAVYRAAPLPDAACVMESL